MWAAWIVAAIALAGVAFMLMFLLALLPELVAPAWRGKERNFLVVMSRTAAEDNWRMVSGDIYLLRDRSPAAGERIFVRLRIEPPWQSG